MLYVGVDPGCNGALAIVQKDGQKRHLVDVVCWSPTKRAPGFDCTSRKAGFFHVNDLVKLRNFFMDAQGVAIEGLFVGNARQRIIGTAETAGALYSAASITCPDVEIDRPMASEWRAGLLKIPPNFTAPQCDKYAKLFVSKLYPDEGKINGHGIDAICIALWKSGMRGVRK